MESIVLKISVSAIEAAKAGVNCFGVTTVEVQPSKLSDGGREVLAELLKLANAVTSTSVVYKNGYSHNVPPVPVVPNPEAVLQWLEACAEDLAAKVESRRREKEAEEKKDVDRTTVWLEQADEKMVVRDRFGVWHVSQPYSFAPSMKAEVQARLTKAQQRADQMNEKFADAAKIAKTLKDEAAARRAIQLEDWLKDKGSDSMRKRAVRGLLPEEDLIAAIRNEAYAPLDGFKRYERMTDGEVKTAVDAADSDQAVVYETREAASAHDEDIELMERIEALVPGAVCTLLVHEGKLDDDEQDVSLTRHSVRVAIKVGEFDFTREYLAG
ncbi:MAG: hypothetical protein QE265_12405 [Rhodoferax sp.]|nr:hypothetical protein [Rhodoferax sp.]